MTKQYFSSISKIFISGILVLQLLSISTKTSASFVTNDEIKKGIIDSTQNKFIIKYKGIVENNLEFDVACFNISQNSFYFIVKDENNEVVFEKQYNGKSFSKRIQLPKLEGETKFSFSIVSDRNETLSNKVITISNKVIEDVEVQIN